MARNAIMRFTYTSGHGKIVKLLTSSEHEQRKIPKLSKNNSNGKMVDDHANKNTNNNDNGNPQHRGAGLAIGQLIVRKKK